MKTIIRPGMLIYSICFGLLSIFFVITDIQNDYPVAFCLWSAVYHGLLFVGNLLYSFNLITQGVRKIWKGVFPLVILAFLFDNIFDIINGPHVHQEGTITIILLCLLTIFLFLPTFKAHYAIGFGKELMEGARGRNVLPVTCAIVCFCFFSLHVIVVLLNVATGGYVRFESRGRQYYAEFAKACDSVMAKNPVTTNDYVEVPVTDPSIPKIIRDMHPTDIELESNRVSMDINSDSRFGYSIKWGPVEGAPTNIWVLSTEMQNIWTTKYIQTNR